MRCVSRSLRGKEEGGDEHGQSSMKHAAVLAQVYGRFLDVSALPVKGRIRDMLISHGVMAGKLSDVRRAPVHSTAGAKRYKLTIVVLRC